MLATLDVVSTTSGIVLLQFVTVRPLSRPRLRRGHVVSSGSGGGWGAVDVDGPASLLLGLELFVHLLLFGDDSSQAVSHLLELLLVRVVELVHALGERPVYDVIAAGVLGGCLMYHGDDFTQQRKLLVLGSGAGGRGGVGFLIFFDGAWEFTSSVLMCRLLFSWYPSRPAWSRRGLLTRLCMGSLLSQYPSCLVWSHRGLFTCLCVGTLFSQYPSRPAWSRRSLLTRLCVDSLFSRYRSRPAWSRRGPLTRLCVGSLFSR